jgi:hypothetical protein
MQEGPVKQGKGMMWNAQRKAVRDIILALENYVVVSFSSQLPNSSNLCLSSSSSLSSKLFFRSLVFLNRSVPSARRAITALPSKMRPANAYYWLESDEMDRNEETTYHDAGSRSFWSFEPNAHDSILLFVKKSDICDLTKL